MSLSKQYVRYTAVKESVDVPVHKQVTSAFVLLNEKCVIRLKKKQDHFL